MNSIANDMCEGEKKSMRSVSYKFLVEIGKARSISHDEAFFYLRVVSSLTTHCLFTSDLFPLPIWKT
jgi:hypothetical protein